MFDHVTLRASDREASERFYETVLAVLGVGEPTRTEQYTDWGDLSLYPAASHAEVTRGLHVGLSAPSREAVDAFWQAGIDARYRSDGEPGPRPQYVDDYYGAFLLDPDGNSVEAMLYTGARERPGSVDHLWIRVADVGAAKRFYLAVAPFGGFALSGEREGRATFSAGEGRGSFSVVPASEDWPATAGLHVAFAGDDAAVEGFWQALVQDGGHPDHGAPGERPQYHPGSYAAFVLDPDGNNVEVVNHRR